MAGGLVNREGGVVIIEDEFFGHHQIETTLQGLPQKG